MNKTLTLIACSALVLGAIAAPAMAQDDRPDRSDRASHADERRDAAKERQAQFAEARERCKDHHNETGEKVGPCVRAAAHDDAHKARRTYHHIEKQIDGVEHRIAKMEMMEYRLEAALESGALNETESEKANATLERIDGAQADLVEKLRELYQKLKDIKQRWADHRGDDAPRAYPSDAADADVDADDASS